MQAEIDSIVIRKRARRSLGDLTSLIESLRKHGQLYPILINRQSELIAGNRRLESARFLGWKRISVIVVDRNSEQDSLELEIEENVQRKDLGPEELSQALERLERLRRKPWWRRWWDAFLRLLARVLRRRPDA